MKFSVLAAAIFALYGVGGTSLALSADESKQGTAGDSDKSKSSASGSSGSKKTGEAAPPGAPVIVLVPVAIATTQSFGNGCWARLHDGENFRGNQLTLVGPVDMPNMRTAFGTDWGGEFDSIVVGPKATVTVYDNENYRQKAATFKPNQKVANMGGNQISPFEDVRSLKIACAGGGPTAQQQDGGSAAGAGGSGTGSAGSGSSSGTGASGSSGGSSSSGSSETSKSRP